MNSLAALVTDVNLKGQMKGWEIARLVRQIDPAFPVVYMTGAGAEDWASEGVPNSILLKKPFKLDLHQPFWRKLRAGTTKR
jgi:DNA-binding NtrC family response regulator